MAAKFTQRHQRSIIPQPRHTTGTTRGGQYKPKPGKQQGYNPNRMMRAQQLPSMLTATSGAIGEK